MSRSLLVAIALKYLAYCFARLLSIKIDNMPESCTEQLKGKLRALQGHELVEVAEKTGLSRQALYVIRGGESVPTLENAERIVAALGCRLVIKDAAEGAP